MTFDLIVSSELHKRSAEFAGVPKRLAADPFRGRLSARFGPLFLVAVGFLRFVTAIIIMPISPNAPSPAS